MTAPISQKNSDYPRLLVAELEPHPSPTIQASPGLMNEIAKDPDLAIQQRTASAAAACFSSSAIEKQSKEISAKDESIVITTTPFGIPARHVSGREKYCVLEDVIHLRVTGASPTTSSSTTEISKKFLVFFNQLKYEPDAAIVALYVIDHVATYSLNDILILDANINFRKFINYLNIFLPENSSILEKNEYKLYLIGRLQLANSMSKIEHLMENFKNKLRDYIQLIGLENLKIKDNTSQNDIIDHIFIPIITHLCFLNDYLKSFNEMIQWTKTNIKSNVLVSNYLNNYK